MRGSALIELASEPNSSVRRARVPHRAGDLAPVGGGRYLPSVLKTWPMKPSGVRGLLALFWGDLRHSGHCCLAFSVVMRSRDATAMNRKWPNPHRKTLTTACLVLEFSLIFLQKGP